MTPKLEDRIARILAAAVLGSELSGRDIDQCAQALLYDERFRERLADFLIGVARLSTKTTRKDVDPSAAAVANSVRELRQLVERRGLSKKRLIDLFLRVGADVNFRTDSTVSALIDSFVRSASPAMVSRLVNALQLDDSADPFLSGIMKRKED